ncbi:Protein phloem 2-like A9 [Vitis vinifera]|uniref:Protein phloem 2-like A9 n=1 Tax=Vitis vinifera TaxID=29760 RepID=A0A438FQQ9_VITVI|nr:Protein phloem 2-like A9 [Vitis vinifera]
MSSTTTNHDAEEPPKLQRKDGKMKATFNPRQLNVSWGRDPATGRCQKSEGPFGQHRPAELLRVCWLEVSGSVPIGSVPPGTKYRITFQISLKSDAFGWNDCPVYVMAKFGKEGKYSWKKISLQAHYSQPTSIPSTEGLEIETEDANDTIYFGLYDIWTGHWKGGLQLHNATLAHSRVWLVS